MSCFPEPSVMIEVRVLHRNNDAEILCIEWDCPHNSNCAHSKWITIKAFKKRFKPFLCTFYPEITANVQATPKCERRWPLEVYSTPKMGRIAIATTSMPLGTRILETPAFAAVVSDKYRQRYCHFCIRRLSGKAFQCDQCRYSVYCSMECLTTDANTFHELQCDVLVRLGTKKDCDTELPRLVVAVLSMQHSRAFKPKHNPLQNLTVPSVVTSTKHNHAIQLVNLLKKSKLSHFISSDEVHDVVVKVQTNAHPLILNGSVTCGLGLFPEAAMIFNHSCSPNIILAFEPGTRMLTAQNIRTIRPRQALEYAYIDILPSKSRRRQLLTDAFGFDCTCVRCSQEGEKELLAAHGTFDQETTILLQLQTATLIPSQFDVEKVLASYADGREPSAEFVFSLWMVQVNALIQKREWHPARKIIEEMINTWTVEWNLPRYYPVTDALYRQLLQVCTQLELAVKCQNIRSKMNKIGAICGFSD
ncbi:hypothetical protein ABG067_001920 [Albugo candida]